MMFLKIGFLTFLLAVAGGSCSKMKQGNSGFKADDMIIRIAEIEIDSIYFGEYVAILKEEAAASIRLEQGVICIYPMFQKENPTKIRLLEIYASKTAYESHLRTPHFIHYKTATMKMVKSLNLIDMRAIDEESMPEIFAKLRNLI